MHKTEYEMRLSLVGSVICIRDRYIQIGEMSVIVKLATVAEVS